MLDSVSEEKSVKKDVTETSDEIAIFAKAKFPEFEKHMPCQKKISYTLKYSETDV